MENAPRPRPWPGWDPTGPRAPLITRRDVLSGGLALSPGFAAAQGPPIRLAARAAAAGVLYGAAVEPESMDQDPAFAALVRRQCALLTPENVMKWDALRPAPGQFDFRRSDRFMAIAEDVGARVHGHCLVWHEATPPWLGAAATPRRAGDLLVEHVRTVVGRYAGRMGSWDVVNEPVERNDRRSDGLRRSVWLEALGPDYLELAFHTAHEADPRARLDLSDYGLEYDDVTWMVEKRGTMLELLSSLRRRGAPIHALALQGHLDGGRPPTFGAPLRRFLGKVADLGLQIYITELDVDDENVPGSIARRDAVTSTCVGRFLDVVRQEPAVVLVNGWGLSDRYTSKAALHPRLDGAPPRPLPFDAALRPKAAAYVMDQIFGAWASDRAGR